jgi:hypothetical protein
VTLSAGGGAVTIYPEATNVMLSSSNNATGLVTGTVVTATLTGDYTTDADY